MSIKFKNSSNPINVAFRFFSHYAMNFINYRINLKVDLTYSNFEATKITFTRLITEQSA